MTLNIYYYNFQVSSKFWFVYNCQIHINIILTLLFRSTNHRHATVRTEALQAHHSLLSLSFWLIGIHYWRTKCVDEIVIFDVTNVEAKMRFHRSLEWAKSSDAPTPFVDEVVCPPPLPWCYKIMWTAVRYPGAARKIWNDGFFWQMFSPMVLEMELSCPSNAGPC